MIDQIDVEVGKARPHPVAVLMQTGSGIADKMSGLIVQVGSATRVRSLAASGLYLFVRRAAKVSRQPSISAKLRGNWQSGLTSAAFASHLPTTRRLGAHDGY